MTKWIAVLMLAGAVTAMTPDEALAGCTEDYARCLSDAGLLAEPFRSMKDLECGATYVGCVGRRMLFW